MTKESLRNNKTVHTVSPNEGEHHKMNKQKWNRTKTKKKRNEQTQGCMKEVMMVTAPLLLMHTDTINQHKFLSMTRTLLTRTLM
jgi:hypothetical protein